MPPWGWPLELARLASLHPARAGRADPGGRHRGEGASLHCADGRGCSTASASWWVIDAWPLPTRASWPRSPRRRRSSIRSSSPADTHPHGRGAGPRASSQIVRRALAPSSSRTAAPPAVEVALKMALGYWHNRGEPRHRIVVMEHSYHGDTIGAMSVGARGVFNRPMRLCCSMSATVPFPAAGREQDDARRAGGSCRAPEKPAAFIVEPLILGAGGMLFYPPQRCRRCTTICARHDVLFIADEVMTGWGRTGTLLRLRAGRDGARHPVPVQGADRRRGAAGGDAGERSDFRSRTTATTARDMFFHSSSFTANPIACAAATANLAIWREEEVLGRIAALGQALDAGLDPLVGTSGLHNPRRIGAIAAIDLGVADSRLSLDVAPAPAQRCLRGGAC